MLTTHSGSYYDEYRKMKGLGPSRAPGGGGPGDASRGPHGGSTSTDVRAGLVSERLLTDRASYISFLEVQLERVSAACITTQGFDERLEDLAGTVVAMEEKLRNLARYDAAVCLPVRARVGCPRLTQPLRCPLTGW